MATMFFQYEERHDRDRTMWGESPAEVAKSLLAAGADVVGMNCGRGPDRAIVIIREMRAVTDAPLVAYPNAGLPDHHRRQRDVRARARSEMAREYPALLEAGCNIVGACCGSDPEHIRLIAEVVRRARSEPAVDAPRSSTTCRSPSIPTRSCASRATRRASTCPPRRPRALRRGAGGGAHAHGAARRRCAGCRSTARRRRLDEGDVALTIPRIGARWGPVERVAVVVCTIGDALERRVSELWEARELPLAVDARQRGLGGGREPGRVRQRRALPAGVAADLPVTNRISPGYGELGRGRAAALFRSVPATRSA